MPIHAMKHRHQNSAPEINMAPFTVFSYTCLRSISRGFGVILSSEALTRNAYGATRHFDSGIYCSMAFGEAQEQVSGHLHVCDARRIESNDSTPSRRLAVRVLSKSVTTHDTMRKLQCRQHSTRLHACSTTRIIFGRSCLTCSTD